MIINLKIIFIEISLIINKVRILIIYFKYFLLYWLKVFLVIILIITQVTKFLIKDV